MAAVGNEQGTTMTTAGRPRSAAPERSEHACEREVGNAERVVGQVLPGNVTGLDAAIAGARRRRAVVPQEAESYEAEAGEPHERRTEPRATSAADGDVEGGSEGGSQLPREDEARDDEPGGVGGLRCQSADILRRAL